tara:strand:- start:43 stop:453 length:411 start_codon:yes stop_codon:yes gene_type:complete
MSTTTNKHTEKMKASITLHNTNYLFTTYVSETLAEVKQVQEAMKENLSSPTLVDMLNVASAKLAQFSTATNMNKGQGERVCIAIGSVLKAIQIVDGSLGMTLNEVMTEDGARASNICRMAGNDFIRLANDYKNAIS